MKIIIDERERDLYEKCYSIVNVEGNSTFIQLSKRVLPLGDILITTDEDKDVLLVERKSFSDLFASIKDGRYEEQSYRLEHSSGFPPHNIIYLLEGIHAQLSHIEKKLLYSSITSLQFFKGFSVLKTSTIRETAELLVWMANKIDRDLMKGKIPAYLLRTNQPSNIVTIPNDSEEPIQILPIPNINQEMTSANYCKVVKKVKKDNVTPENIGEIILCQIPGISSVTAIAIMKSFQSFPHFIEEIKKNPDILENIQIESNGKMRKINKPSIQNIKDYLLGSATTIAV
jgi:ERCC4-type nuclease